MALRALRRSLVAGVLAATVCSTFAPAPAQAQDKKALSEARRKFQQATELEQAGNYAAAIGLFREVGEVKMTPQVRFHIAYCEGKLGKLVAALGGYELALAEASSVGPGFEKEVQTAIDELKARIPKVVLKRGDGAAGARVEMDGVSLGETSIGTELTVDPGPHLIVAKVGGEKKFSETVTIAEGETKEVTITIAEDAAPVTGGPGAGAGGSATVDTGTTPPSRTVPIIVGSVGVAALAASGVFYMLRQGAISDLEDACGPNRDRCPASSESTYDDAKRYNTFSQIALGVGVVGVGAAAALWLTASPAEKPAAKTGLLIAPSAPAAPAGVTVLGRF